MTMLDRMRRHKNWLKWSLFIVVLAFIFLYIPSFLGNPSVGTGPQDVIASVDGHDITVGRYRRIYAQQLQAYRAAYGGNLDERLLKQLGIEQRVIQQMLEEEAAIAEAGRLGITATDEEVQARIVSIPAFQENGVFIGEPRYRQLLQMQNPPMQTEEFEDQMRRSITTDKLRSALTDWITVSENDVQDEFKKRNEKVKLAVVSFPADKFREGVQPTDAEISSYFDAHKNDFKVPEKRKVRYAALDLQAIRSAIQVTAVDVQRSYEDNQQQYSTPEQVRASHILLKTEGKDDAAVKKQAEDLLKQAKGGADFAQLATKYSEDDASKIKGGDLDYFGKGQMVAEFDKAAFSMKPGEISDLVKSEFGYHIIKLIDTKPATTRSLDEVKAQIEDQLKWDRAQTQAQKVADDVELKLKKPDDLDTITKPRGFNVGETPLFGKDDPIPGIGLSPALAARAFELKPGEVSEAIRTPQGFAFITLTGTQDGYVPKVDEVKAKVRDEVVKKKAVEAARQRAASIDAQLKSGDFDKAAKSAGVEVKTTDLITRGAPIGDVGASPAIDAVAFSLPVGSVSDPIVTDNGAVIVKVLERKDPAPAEVTSGIESTRTDLLTERRGRFYAAYMTKARDRMKINLNRDVIAQLTT